MSQTAKAFTLLLILAAAGLAQNRASVGGTVRDQTGAVVPGATVVLTSVETGASLTTVTNTEGNYLIGGLGEGKYDLTVTQSGFRKFSAPGIVIEVAQKARV